MSLRIERNVTDEAVWAGAAVVVEAVSFHTCWVDESDEEEALNRQGQTVCPAWAVVEECNTPPQTTDRKSVV